MEKISEESFTVILDATEVSNNIIINVILELLINETGYIKLINFNNQKFKFDYILQGLKQKCMVLGMKQKEVQNRIKLIEPKSMILEDIVCSIDEQIQDDNIVLLGAERLFSSLKGQSLSFKQYNTTAFRTFQQQHLPWEEIINNVLNINRGTQDKRNKFICIITTDDSCFEKITNILKKVEEPEILYLSLDNSEYINTQEKIVNAISSINLEEIKELIKQNTEILSDTTATYYLAMAHEYNGLRKEAIQMYKSIFEILSSEEKVFVAELLDFEGESDDAYKILVDIYEIDQWTKNLLGAVLKISKKVDYTQYEKWIQIAIDRKDKNEFVLQEIGNYLMSKKNYLEASIYWRQLLEATQNPFFELMEKFNYAYYENISRDIAEELLLDVVRNNPHLHDEAYLRIGIICLDKYNSPFKSLIFLNRMSDDHMSDVAYRGAIQRIKIIKDPKLASRALGKIKPYEKANHADTLADNIVNELVRDIMIFADKDYGYHRWEDFIEKAQSLESWREHLSIKITKELENWNEKSAQINQPVEIIEESSQITASKIIGMLRMAKTGIPKEFNIDERELIDNAIKGISINGNLFDVINARYEASIILSLIGENQFANDHALTILQMATKLENKLEREEAKVIGLMAWSNSQYRLGNHVEGIACLISSFSYAIDKNLYSVLNDACNILSKWLVENANYFTKKTKENLVSVINNLNRSLIEDVDQVQNFMVLEDWEKVYKILKLSLNDDINSYKWTENLTNLINACVNTQREEEAYNLIKNHYNIAIKGLEKRKDLRFKILFTWCQVVFSNLDDVDSINLCIHLLNISINDIEERRAQIYHKTERAAFTAEARLIYMLYMDIQNVIYKTEEFSIEEKNKAFNEIIVTFSKLSFRTIAEQLDQVNDDNNEEIKKLRLEYEALNDEVSRITNYALKESQLKINRLRKLQMILKDNHSAFKALPNYSVKDIDNIQSILKEDEVFFSICIN